LPAPRSKVSAWLQRYQAEGVDGLLEGYRSGRPAELSEKQKQQLGDILDSGPVAYGLDTGLWTSPRIAWIIEQEFGVQYTIPVMCASCCIPGDFRCSGHGVCWSAPMRRPRIAGIAARILLSKKSTIPTLGVDLYG
jgi:Homeodomain-like domain